MNLEQLRQKLIASARVSTPEPRVPYGFSTRVISRIKGCRPLDAWGFWAHALWRATAPCVAVALILGAWSLVTTLKSSSGSGNGAFDVAQEFENTLLAGTEFDSPDSLR
jgi:hypothetical protein